MHFVDSVLAESSGWAHGLAAIALLLSAIWFVRELLRPRSPSARKPARASERAPQPEEPRAVPLQDLAAPVHDADRELLDQVSSLGAAQVFLLCPDNVEPDEMTSPSLHFLIDANGDSDAGKKRARNEDSFLLSADHSLFAVADGMGGYHGGKEASSLAIETLRRAFDETAFDDEFQCDIALPRRGRELVTAMVKANDSVLGAARADPELAEMGTTLVVARFLPHKRRVYIAHVGDSRCYRFRASTLTQLTTDHTLRNLGIHGPHANDLSRAVGIERNVHIDLLVDVPCADDIYLLCSDGLPKMVSDRQIEQTLRGEKDLEAAVYQLIELANDAGGKDNVTVVLVRVREQSRRAKGVVHDRALLAASHEPPAQSSPRQHPAAKGAP